MYEYYDVLTGEAKKMEMNVPEVEGDFPAWEEEGDNNEEEIDLHEEEGDTDAGERKLCRPLMNHNL